MPERFSVFNFFHYSLVTFHWPQSPISSPAIVATHRGPAFFLMLFFFFFFWIIWYIQVKDIIWTYLRKVEKIMSRNDLEAYPILVYKKVIQVLGGYSVSYRVSLPVNKKGSVALTHGVPWAVDLTLFSQHLWSAIWYGSIREESNLLASTCSTGLL